MSGWQRGPGHLETGPTGHPQPIPLVAGALGSTGLVSRKGWADVICCSPIPFTRFRITEQVSADG